MIFSFSSGFDSNFLFLFPRLQWPLKHSSLVQRGIVRKQGRKSHKLSEDNRRKAADRSCVRQIVAKKFQITNQVKEAKPQGGLARGIRYKKNGKVSLGPGNSLFPQTLWKKETTEKEGEWQVFGLYGYTWPFIECSCATQVKDSFQLNSYQLNQIPQIWNCLKLPVYIAMLHALLKGSMVLSKYVLSSLIKSSLLKTNILPRKYSFFFLFILFFNKIFF